MNNRNGLDNKSVQGRAHAAEWAQASDLAGDAPFSFLVNIGTRLDEIPAWNPIYPNGRDAFLTRWSRQETMMASAIYTLKTRIQTLNYEVSGPTRARNYALDLLDNPGLDDNIMSFTGKVIGDLLTADNGAFIELWRLGNYRDDTSPIVGFGHLDSRQCWRTFNPEYPVIYTNPQTYERFKLHRNQVLMTADNVQSVELARGIGYCAVSRAVQWTRIVRSIMNYTDEKISGRFTRAIGLVSGITKNQLKKGLEASRDDAEDAGFFVYQGIPIFASPGMTAGSELKMVLQDLASIPDGFDFWDDITLYAYILAWVFGTDAREFWPATVSGATKADATVQNMKSRGKGIGWLIETMEWVFRHILPATAKFQYDYTDDEQDFMQAQIQEKRTGILSSLNKIGAIESWEVRALAIAEGIIDGELLETLTPPAESGDTADNAPDDEGMVDSQADEEATDTEDNAASNADGEGDNMASKTEATFRDGLRSAVRGLWSGDLSLVSGYDALQSTIRRHLTQAWLAGAAQCGIKQADLTDSEWASLNNEIIAQYGYLPGLVADVINNSQANGGSLEPLYTRLDLWVNQYNRVLAMGQASACADQKMIWVLGATEEHCTDCARASGRVYRMSVWQKYGWQPQSPGLECGGWRCDCRFEVTDESITPGRPPALVGPGAKAHVHVD